MSKRKPRPRLWSPRVWGTWLLVALGWVVAHLPLRVAVGLGTILGRLALHVAPGRRRIAEVNLELCFPQLGREERQALLARNFAHTGVGLVEAIIVWLNPRRPLYPRCTVTGLEHLQEAQRQGRGVLLISGDRHGARGFRIPRPSGFAIHEFEAATLGGVPGPAGLVKNCPEQLFGYDGSGFVAFGEFTFDTAGNEPMIIFRLIDETGRVREEHGYAYHALTPAGG